MNNVRIVYLQFTNESPLMNITMKLFSKSFFWLYLIVISPLMLAQETSDSNKKTNNSNYDVELSDTEKLMVSWIDSKQKSMVKTLRKHVEHNTGTDNIDGLNQYSSMLQKQLKTLGFKTKKHSSDPIEVPTCEGKKMNFADNLIGKRKGSSTNRILLNGHMDTVFSATDEFQTLAIEEGGVLHGPGVADMKGGIVVMLYALQALQEAKQLQKGNITVLFNSDEEIGSLGSRPLIEQEAVKHDIGLVFEGTYKNRMTSARKGLGQVRLMVEGRESHAGGNHSGGVSANLELAHKIVNIDKITDYTKKIAVNTGVMQGGEKRNTVAGCADAYIDMRYPSAELGEDMIAQIETIAKKQYTVNANYPDLPKTTLWTKLHRPAKPRHPVVDHLIKDAMKLSAVLGEPVVGDGYSGGGTDGSITQGVGLPTADSFGLNGEGAHSSRERTTVASLVARTKLAAVLISRLIDYDEKF